MAKRKRHRTQKSRSRSTAARPQLTLGDVVRVKDGVRDPDYDGYSIGGWSGAIIAFATWEQTPMALIAWDATTLHDRIDPEVRRRAASQGLSTAQMWLQLSDLERVDVIKGAPRSKVQPRGQGGEPSAAPWTPPSCGHTYPDVLRLRDEVRADGTFVRITDCRHCGRADSLFRRAFWPRSCDVTLKPRALCRGLLRMRSRLFVGVQSDDGIRVAVPGHGGSGGGGGAKSRATWGIH